jgi:hypothetical protein
MKTNIFFGILIINEERSRIRTKMSRIPNTAFYLFFLSLVVIYRSVCVSQYGTVSVVVLNIVIFDVFLTGQYREIVFGLSIQSNLGCKERI